MHPRVQLLADEVIDRIAAGEVVERPASVVKELLENALDAAATHVGVYLRGGGLTEIRVVDDGRGMDAADAATALLRHATSKIRTDADLAGVQSLGFRGEALPSIASVSDFHLLTGVGLDDAGCRAALDGGRPVVQEAPPRRGTVVVVRDLFGKVPARRKFLKAPRTEVRRAHLAVQRAAMARPDVGFTVEHDGRRLFHAPSGESRAARARRILGRRVAETLAAVGPAGDDRLSIEGFVAPAAEAAGGADRLHLVLDGRPVRDGGLVAAVRQAYGPDLPRGRTPAGVLWLQASPGEVDVNVHPAKTEVRFADPRATFRVVLGAVRRALAPRLPGAEASGAPAPTTPRPWEQMLTARSPHATDAGEGQTTPARTLDPASVRPPVAPPSTVAAASEGPLHVVQVGQRFLVAARPDGLRLFDRAEAHAQVLAAGLRAALEQGPLPPAPLLFPEPFEASTEEMEACRLHAALLTRYGFEVDEGGPRALVVRACPRSLRHAPLPALIRAILRVAPGDGADEGPAIDALARAAAARPGDPMEDDDARRILAAVEAHAPRPRGSDGGPWWADVDAEAIAAWIAATGAPDHP